MDQASGASWARALDLRLGGAQSLVFASCKIFSTS